MGGARVLVVHYSRTGNTRRVAGAIARALGADSEQIADRADRAGPLGYLRSALEAILGASTGIGPPGRDVAGYDLVVVGTPVWYASVSSPVRTWLRLVRRRLPEVAFFLTHGGMGAERVMSQMAALAGKRPAARLVVRRRDLESGADREKVEAFARSLARGLGAGRPRGSGRGRRRTKAPARLRRSARPPIR